MKKLLLLLFLCIASFEANAQWYKLKNYPTITDTSNWYAYPLSPYPAGNGVIIYGVSWGSLSSIHDGGTYIMESKDDLDTCNSVFSDGSVGGTPFLFDASKNDSTHCVIDLYDSNKLYYTSNNFKTVSVVAKFWNSIDIITNLTLCFSPDYIYSVGQVYSYSSNPSDTIMISRSCVSPAVTKQYPNTKYTNPTRMFFTTDSTGFMLSEYTKDSAKSVLAMTSDSGKTWIDSFLDSVHIITGSSFPSESIGYLTKNNGNIYKTTNAGLTWTQLSSPVTVSLNCVSFSNNTNGYVGGYAGTLYRTIDGGTTWTKETSSDTNPICALYTFDTVAYFIDTIQNIYKNESLMGIESIQTPASVIKVYPNPSTGKFTFQSSVVNGKLLVEVYNMLGEQVYSQLSIPIPIAIGTQYQIDLSNQSAGVYFYRVLSDGKFVGSGKLVIER